MTSSSAVMGGGSAGTLRPTAIVSEVARAGFRLWVDASGGLKCEGPGALPDELKATVREHRDGVRAVLLRAAAEVPGYCRVPELELPMVKGQTDASKPWADAVIDYVLGQTWAARDWAMARRNAYAEMFEVWSEFRCDFEAALDLVVWQRSGKLKASQREKQFHEVYRFIDGIEEVGGLKDEGLNRPRMNTDNRKFTDAVESVPTLS